MVCFVSRSNVFNATLSQMFYNFIPINIEGEKQDLSFTYEVCVAYCIFCVLSHCTCTYLPEAPAAYHRE